MTCAQAAEDVKIADNFAKMKKQRDEARRLVFELTVMPKHGPLNKTSIETILALCDTWEKENK